MASADSIVGLPPELRGVWGAAGLFGAAQPSDGALMTPYLRPRRLALGLQRLFSVLLEPVETRRGHREQAA